MAGFIGGGRGINNAQTFVRLKPLAERKVSAQVVAERIRANLPHVAGARMFLDVEQDIRFGGRGGGGGGGGGTVPVHAARRRHRAAPRVGAEGEGGAGRDRRS